MRNKPAVLDQSLHEFGIGGEGIFFAAGDDYGSQEVSDQEQMEYIEMWMKQKKRKA